MSLSAGGGSTLGGKKLEKFGSNFVGFHRLEKLLALRIVQTVGNFTNRLFNHIHDHKNEKH